MGEGKPAQVEREMTDAPVVAAPETDTAATITTEDQKPAVAQDDGGVQTEEVSEPSEEKAPEEPIPEEPTATASSDQQAPSPASFPFAQMHPAGPAAGYAIGGSKFLASGLCKSGG
jgi:hypothetical protein